MYKKGKEKKMYESLLKRSPFKGVLTERKKKREKRGCFVFTRERESALKNREVVCAEKS